MNQISYTVSKKTNNQNYNLLADKFLGIINKHAPAKKKFARGK